ncbi:MULTISPECIES: ABC transporter permease [Nocardiopsis]|uniref:ABC transporter permease n=1 Tax=Nocardiopsis TaxID=2013 RepID=UPI00034ACC69|nr:MULTISPECIES: ABC transporter permease [Nocardiopsis]PWV57264.1 ABC-2 type transport system permease protein [Nocardiopsis sp. L17-MgMaSL7]
MTNALSVLRHDLIWLRRDPVPFVTLLLTPCLLMSFTAPLYAVVTSQFGYDDASGADLSVPGMALMFSFFMGGVIKESIFREFELHTWKRVRVSGLSARDLLCGKVLLGGTLVLMQSSVLFLVGWLLLGLNVRGSVAALVVLLVAVAACVVSFSLALCALARSRSQAFAYDRVVTLLWTVVGGALVPIDLMPSWVRALATVTPVYWAISGLREVIVGGGDLRQVVAPVACLLAFSSVFAVIAFWRVSTKVDKVFRS